MKFYPGSSVTRLSYRVIVFLYRKFFNHYGLFGKKSCSCCKPHLRYRFTCATDSCAKTFVTGNKRAEKKGRFDKEFCLQYCFRPGNRSAFSGGQQFCPYAGKGVKAEKLL